MDTLIDFICGVVSYYNSYFAISATGLLVYYILHEKYTTQDDGDLICQHVAKGIISVVFANLISFALPFDYRFMLTMPLLIPAIIMYFVFLIRSLNKYMLQFYEMSKTMTQFDHLNKKTN